MAVQIITPRPPLNLFEVIRLPLSDQWETIYEVPFYRIPASGPNPEQIIQTAAIMTGILVTPTGGGNARASLRILSATNVPFPIIDQAYAPANDFLSMVLDRQVVRSGELIQMKIETGEQAYAHFSFILNQREAFTVLT